MRTDPRPVTQLFHGVCPACGTVGLEIFRADRTAGLSCPNCEWDSLADLAATERRDSTEKQVSE